MSKNVFILFAFCSLNAWGMVIPPNYKLAGASLTVGHSQLNTDAIQSFIPKHLRTFNKKQLLLGGSGFVASNKWIIGVTGTLTIGDKVKTDSFSYALSGAFGTLDLAYLLLKNSKTMVYPMIGIGNSAYGVGISRFKNLNKDQMTGTQNRDVRINNGGLIVDVSFNIQTIVQRTPDRNKNKGLLTGLKLGYLYGIKNSSWHYTGGIVTNGPSYGMRMWYAKFSIGLFKQ